VFGGGSIALALAAEKPVSSHESYIWL
jgi:hypothetical protein